MTPTSYDDQIRNACEADPDIRVAITEFGSISICNGEFYLDRMFRDMQDRINRNRQQDLVDINDRYARGTIMGLLAYFFLNHRLTDFSMDLIQNRIRKAGVLCQLDQSIDRRDDRRPRLSDLGSVGELNHYADKVLLMYREDYYSIVIRQEKSVLIINLTNKRYGIIGRFDISEDIWTKHLAMHPKRPEEALQNNLSVCYGINSPVMSCMVERVIEDKYRMCQSLPGIIAQAREIYRQNNLLSRKE